MTGGCSTEQHMSMLDKLLSAQMVGTDWLLFKFWLLYLLTNHLNFLCLLILICKIGM